MMNKLTLKIKSSWLFHLVIGLSVGLLIAAHPAEQADGLDVSAWPTFVEPAFGFQIQYPPDWHVSLVADNVNQADSYDEQVALRSIGFFGPESQIIFVDIWANPQQLSPAGWLEEHPPHFLKEGLDLQTAHNLTVAEEAAVKLSAIPQTTGGVPWHYRTQFNQADLSIGVEYAALAPDDAIYQAMLDSFAFVLSTQNRNTPSTLSNQLPPAEFGVQEATCCDIVDPEYNPFPCNTGGDAACPFPPCGNCTWWVRYRRQGSADANAVHCTGDGDTWFNCAAQYYPSYLLSYPDTEAIVIYPGINHVSFVEDYYDGGAYAGSDMSWQDSCPPRYFSDQMGTGKQYLHNPEGYVPNQAPNAPAPYTPEEDVWLNALTVELTWQDRGDPDDSPNSYRDFLTEIWNENDWRSHSGWRSTTYWELDLPEDGQYTWRSKSHDGILESIWSDPYQFNIDTTPPGATFVNSPALNKWYNTEQTITWTGDDAGAGTDYALWAWDATPVNQLDGEDGSINLSSAGQGQHTLQIQIWDRAGNASQPFTWGWLGYDTVPPQITLQNDSPAAGQWYNRPQTIQWQATDPAPGIGPMATFLDWDTTTLRYKMGHLGTLAQPWTQGQHALYWQAQDWLRNTSSIGSPGWFGYDSLIPNSPGISTDCTVNNNEWQNHCTNPTFTWTASDPFASRSSGIVDYGYVWSGKTTISPTFVGELSSYTPNPINPARGWGKYYFHLQTKDAAGNLSSPATFGFLYDSTAPSITFAIKEDANQTLPLIPLSIWGADTGSGLAEVRLANNNQQWSTWQLYTYNFNWSLSPDNAPNHTIYLQGRDKAGNISTVVSQTITLTGTFATIAPPKSKAILPPTAVNNFEVTLNEAKLFTNMSTVTATTVAPNVTKVRLSSNPTYQNNNWQPYPHQALFSIPETREPFIPYRLYAWFQDEEGTIYGPYFDDIIYDAVRPWGSVTIVETNGTMASLYLPAWDDNSGLTMMRIGLADTITTTEWQPYAETIDQAYDGHPLYVQFRDRAGNLSSIYGTDGSNLSLYQYIYLPITQK